MSGGRRRVVLAAEDNDAHRMVLHRVMRDASPEPGFELRFVRDGAELLTELGQRDLPDVVLLDLHMPVVSGLDALRAIRDNPALRAVPVVILSSSSEERHVSAAYLEGANAYLVKRGDYGALVEQMRHFAAFWLGTALLPGRVAAQAGTVAASRAGAGDDVRSDP